MSRPYHSGIEWTAVDAVIFDVDGTLFDHKALRRPMLARMLSHFVTGRLRWRDIQTVRLFRRERTRLALAEAENIGARQFDCLVAAARGSRHEVEAIVTRWMFREPLAFVQRYGFPDAGRFVKALHERGIRTGVFSDYPAHGKLEALGISIEVVRDAAEADVGRLKPQPHGFIRVADLLRVSPHRCLIIGDRDDRDGEAARRGGFLFLKKVAAGRSSRRLEFGSYGELMPEVDQGHRDIRPATVSPDPR